MTKLTAASTGLNAAQALATDKALPRGRYSDGRNLYLNVSASGSKSWVFVWKLDGKQYERGLGSATGAGKVITVTLAKARLLADRVRVGLVDGFNPVLKAKEERVDRAKAGVTFRSLIEDTVVGMRAKWRPNEDGVLVQELAWRRAYELMPESFLDLPINKVDTDAVVSVIKPYFDAGKLIPYDRYRMYIEAVLARAIAMGHLPKDMANPARYKKHIELIVGVKQQASSTKSHTSIDAAQMPEIASTLMAAKGVTAKALLFTVLSGVRSAEARPAKKTEIDWDAKKWVVPAVRMKKRVEHHVPLTTTQIAILEALFAEFPDSDLIFPASKGGTLNEGALLQKLTAPVNKGGLGLKGKATVHGMRSTFTDYIGDEVGWAKDEDREHCLAHKLDAVTGAYRRKDAVERRRKIMQAWDDYCMGKTAKSNDNVVAITKKVA